MNVKQYFRRKRQGRQQEQKPAPQPLRIEGIGPAPLTPEPDEAELAAQALLEHMCESLNMEHGTLNIKANAREPKKKMVNGQSSMVNEPRDAAYYRQLADRIRQAHEAATQRTLRFVAFVEQELQKPSLPLSGPGSLRLLEEELYKRLDVIERRGGELKKRWQHCLATVIVRRMQAEGTTDEKETTDSTD